MNNLCKLIAASAIAGGFTAPVVAQDSINMTITCIDFMANAADRKEELVKEIKTSARANSMLYLLEPDIAQRIFEAACDAYPDGTVLEAFNANMM